MTDIDTTYGPPAPAAPSAPSSTTANSPGGDRPALGRRYSGRIDQLHRSGLPAARAASGFTSRSGFFELLADFFMPADDRYVYAEGLSRGGYLVTVRRPDRLRTMTAPSTSSTTRVAIDLDERSEAWRSEGLDRLRRCRYGRDRSRRGRTGRRLPGRRHHQPGRGRAGDRPRRGRDRSGDRGAPPGRQARREPRARPGAELRRRGAGLARRSSSQRIGCSSSAARSTGRSPTPTTPSATGRSRPRSTPKRRSSPRRRASSRRIGIRREHDSRRETVSDTIRRTEVEIEDDARRRAHRAREGRAHPLTRALAQTAGIEARGRKTRGLSFLRATWNRTGLRSRPSGIAAMELREALTFDDVLLVPGASEVLPATADTRTRLTGDGHAQHPAALARRWTR